MIERKEYLSELIGYKDTPLIKIISGIRRCGKSTLLELYQQYLLENGVVESQIIAINFEDMNYAEINTAKKLHNYLEPLIIKDKMNYIFLDEIQKVVEFEKVIDSLQLKKNADVYVTGSNAYFLSSEFATYISGRYVEIKMLPLSFKEYLSYVGDKTDFGRKYSNYLQFSSFPQAVYFNNDANKVRGYLDGIYNSVIMKDIMTRKKIADKMMLESVIKFVFDNVGNLYSTNKIANTMTHDGRSISTHTVESYLTSLKESFIIYQAKRYDIKGKQYLKTNDKYYLCDLGLRFYLLGNKGSDRGRMLENVVYLELLRKGFDVYVGKVDEKEVDFVAQKGDITEYYQVAETVREKATLERELASLEAINDHNPKFLLTLDDDPPANHNGIRQLNALDFLMGNWSVG